MGHLLFRKRFSEKRALRHPMANVTN